MYTKLSPPNLRSLSFALEVVMLHVSYTLWAFLFLGICTIVDGKELDAFDNEGNRQNIGNSLSAVYNSVHPRFEADFEQGTKNVDIDLCTKEMTSFSSRALDGVETTVLYTFSTTNCAKNFEIYHFMTEEFVKVFDFSIFDGDVTTGTKVDIQYFGDLTQKQEGIRFTNKKATVKITRKTESAAAVFGVATTAYITGSAPCGGVYGVYRPTRFTVKKEANCVNVLYHHWDEFNVYNGMSVEFGSNEPIKFLKGATTADKFTLIGSAGERPPFIYGVIVTIITTDKTEKFNVTLTKATRSKWDQSFDAPGVISSIDYADPQPSTLGAAQNITLRYRGGKGEHSIILQMMKELLAEETLSIDQYDSDDVISTKKYSTADKLFRVDANATKIVLQYRSTKTSENSGLIASYDLGKAFIVNDDGDGGKAATVPNHASILCAIFIYYIFA